MILRAGAVATPVVVVGRQPPQIIRFPAAAAIQGDSCCCALARPPRALAFPPLLLSFRPSRAAGPMSSSTSAPSPLTPASERREEAAVAPAAEEAKMEGASSNAPAPAAASDLPAAAPSPPLPPPPEVPDPGDCCGSGCVRCVWDIYYDELEAYNKLIAERSPGTE